MPAPGRLETLKPQLDSDSSSHDKTADLTVDRPDPVNAPSKKRKRPLPWVDGRLNMVNALRQNWSYSVRIIDVMPSEYMPNHLSTDWRDLDIFWLDRLVNLSEYTKLNTERAFQLLRAIMQDCLDMKLSLEDLTDAAEQARDDCETQKRMKLAEQRQARATKITALSKKVGRNKQKPSRPATITALRRSKQVIVSDTDEDEDDAFGPAKYDVGGAISSPSESQGSTRSAPHIPVVRHESSPPTSPAKRWQTTIAATFPDDCEDDLQSFSSDSINVATMQVHESTKATQSGPEETTNASHGLNRSRCSSQLSDADETSDGGSVGVMSFQDTPSTVRTSTVKNDLYAASSADSQGLGNEVVLVTAGLADTPASVSASSSPKSVRARRLLEIDVEIACAKLEGLKAEKRLLMMGSNPSRCED